jgi:Na+/proline symporter
MDLDRVWKVIAAGLCGSAAHSALMGLKSWAQLLPSFQPYQDLQAMLTGLVGSSVHPLVPWALSYFNGSVVLSFLFNRVYRRLPGRNGAMKGAVFGLFVWIAMGLTFFPLIGKGLFATQAGLGIVPTLFTLVMVLTYSVTLGIAYSVFRSESASRAR